MNSDPATTLAESLDYKPVASKFGTSGVRALVKDLTDLEVYCLTMGTLRYLQTTNKIQLKPQDPDLAIPLGGDLRPSTDRLILATAKAILDAGYSVDYVGKLPTPALTYYALQRGVCSFMVTCSHIPVDRNGQKANRCDGEILKSDEAGVSAAVDQVRQQQYSNMATDSIFDQSGMLQPNHKPQLNRVNNEATEEYLSRYQSVFKNNALTGKRVAFFQYAAVGRDILPKILENAGVEVYPVGRSDLFEAIDTEAISEEHLHRLLQIILNTRNNHGRLDALLSCDGDSDRPLVIAVEEKTSVERVEDYIQAIFSGLQGLVRGDSLQKLGKRFDLKKASVRVTFIPGDLLGSLVADVLKADSVSIPISANPAVHEFFTEMGISTQKTRIGSPFVIQAMKEASASGAKRIVAWEANGGFLVGSDLNWNSNSLTALPTRDAILPMLCILFSAQKQKLGLNQLLDQLPNWYGKADLIDHFPRETSEKIIRRYSLADENLVWLILNENNLQLCDAQEKVVQTLAFDAPQAKLLMQKKKELESFFSADKGFGRISRINCQDGIRCFFDNDDIAHVRPSGNAPQLRMYAQARSKSRADSIVKMGIEDGGILQSLAAFIESQDAVQK